MVKNEIKNIKPSLTLKTTPTTSIPPLHFRATNTPPARIGKKLTQHTNPTQT